MVVLLTVDPDQLTGVFGGDNYLEYVGVTDAQVDIEVASKGCTMPRPATWPRGRDME